MKRTILFAAAALMAAVSCQKSIDPANPSGEVNGTIDVRVNGLMGEYTQADAVKAELVNTVRVSWKGGETVYVYDGTSCIGSLVSSLEGTEDRYAVLSTDGDSHKITTPAGGTTKLTLVYSPLLTEAPAVSEGSISVSLASQSGEKAPFVAYATLEYNGETTITGAVVPFKFATSVIRANCTGLKADTAIDQVTLDNVNTNCVLGITGDSEPSVGGASNGVITRTGSETCSADKVNAEGEAVFQIAVPSLETASEVRVLTVTQGLDAFKDYNFTKKSLPAATSVNSVCQLRKIPAGALPGVFTVSDNGGETTKQVHFSKGNLYYDGSNFNFEANQYGFNSSYQSTYVSHFYWSKDVEEAVKQDFNWEQSMSAGDVFFTNVDGFKVNVGGKDQTGWRTLSTNEWQYLFSTRENANTKYGFATVGNVTGIILLPDTFTDPMKNGGSGAFVPKSTTGWTANTYTTGGNWEAMESAGAVFLPAVGSRSGSFFFNDVGDFGFYWFSTAYDELNAYYVGFSSDDVVPDYYVYRYNGFSVRLVTESK